MGLNQNHIVEEVGGTRCAIVEKNITPERAAFLTELLNGNGFTVVVAEAAAPKAKAAPKAAAPEGETAEAAPAPEATEEPKAVLLTLGVTDVSFNPINGIYGRLLRTSNGHVVTPDYWFQKDAVSHDEIPYYMSK